MEPQAGGAVTAQKLEEKIRNGIIAERKKIKAENANKDINEANGDAVDHIDKADHIEITEIGGKMPTTACLRLP